MLLAAAGLVIRDAKLDVSVEVRFLQEHQQTILSSISSAQTARCIKPVARQRDDQARPRKVAAGRASHHRAMISSGVQQLDAILRWSRSDEGRIGALHLAESR
jgi:hypothetical protein